MAQGRINTQSLIGTATHAVLTKTSAQTPPADHRFRVAAFAASYSAAPTGGNLQVGGWDGAAFTALWDEDMGQFLGPFGFPQNLDLRLPPGQAVRVILADGGAAVVGKVNVIYYLEQ